MTGIGAILKGIGEGDEKKTQYNINIKAEEEERESEMEQAYVSYPIDGSINLDLRNLRLTDDRSDLIKPEKPPEVSSSGIVDGDVFFSRERRKREGAWLR